MSSLRGLDNRRPKCGRAIEAAIFWAFSRSIQPRARQALNYEACHIWKEVMASMSRRDMITFSLLLGGGLFLSVPGNYAGAVKHPTRGAFDNSSPPIATFCRRLVQLAGENRVGGRSQ